jgi:DNA ligase (NAD+)
MVIIFDVPYREELGENEHDPNFSVSIKMIPEIATSDVIGIEWNVGKTGELAPVVLLTPVKLAGTSVKRASGYNAGYIQNKPIRIGSKVTVCKRGDIIPAIQSILYTPEEINTSISLPTHCTDCNSELTFDGIHLMCNNEDCPGRIAKILASSLQVMKIKRIGRKTIAPFAKDFSDLVQLIVWARTKGAGDSKDIEKYDIAYNSRSHEIFLEAFNNITSLSYAKIIQSLGYTNVGKTLSLQIANEHAGVPFDYGNLEKALVESMRAPEVTYWIKYCVKSLEEVGIKVDRPFIVDTKDAIFVCLTGSPSSAGFGTKADFLDHYTGRLVECDLKDKNCNYLVTNDLDSKTSKMTTAVKKGIKIVTYKYDF